MTEELTERQMLEALYDKFIVEGEEPEPPPGPEPSRPTALVKVIVDKCHLRFVSHKDDVGKAVWGSYPKGSDNPKRDRYLIYLGYLVKVYMDGDVRYGKYKGAFRGSGMAHGWEVCAGQTFNGHIVMGYPKRIGYTRLYILCRDAKRV